jgi:hypothetical protein
VTRNTGMPRARSGFEVDGGLPYSGTMTQMQSPVHTPSDVQVFRPRPVLYIILGGAQVLFAAGFVFMLIHSTWSWTTIGFAAMTLFGALGFVELGTTRVVLADDGIEMGPIWTRRRYRIDEIKRVTWEKGAGVALELKAGGWAKLPEMGFNAQGLSNTIRAWLKRHGA